MQKEADVKPEEGFRDNLKKRLLALREWVKPKPNDPLWLTVIKLIYKSIALLILVALSPVLLLLLLIVFFATL